MRKRIDLTALVSRYRSAVMGVCGLFILFFHCWVPTLDGFPVIGWIEAWIKKNGYFCVDVFFFLSGVGLTYAMRKDRRILPFYIKRLKRVGIPFAEICVLEALVKGFSLGKLLFHITGVGLFVHGIYAHLWFVPAIMLLYLMYPLLNMALERTERDTALLAGGIAAFILAGILMRGAVAERYWGILYRIPTFLLGVLFGRMGQKRPVVCRGWQCAGLCAALMLAYAAGHHLVSMTGWWMLTAVQLSAFSALFVIAIAGICACLDGCRRLAPLRFGVRCLEWCGLFTLELYGLQGFYWQIAGPMEGRLTYLQTNLIVMVVFPLISGLLMHMNACLMRRLDGKGARQRK